jgi:hypothetical protein
MMKRGWMLLLILFAVVGFSGMANAGLIKIGTATYGGKDYNLIYEDDQGLIWLDYTNPANRWLQQTAWAAGLNASGVLTYKLNAGIRVTWDGDWRLPKAADGVRKGGYDGKTTAGFNITTSEMGHLYYVSLGNLGYYDTKGNMQDGWGGLHKTGPFNNLLSNSYWSGTVYSEDSEHAWDFSMHFGDQDNNGFKDSDPYYGLAVRPGHVVSAPVR